MAVMKESPEDLLVTATASCFALTLAAVAERSETPLLDATISATGHMSRRDDGRFGFTLIEITAGLETLAGAEEAVRRAAHAAEQRCLITQALDVPVHVAVDVTVPVDSLEVAR
jgi:organic hydroperoxide reductase OsmC/OhrA